MPGKTLLLSLAVASCAALCISACESTPAKPAAPKAVAVASAPAPAPAPTFCQEQPDKRMARVAGGQMVSMTTCSKSAADWAAQRPGLEALRPHLNP
jgi:hypothetical protein